MMILSSCNKYVYKGQKIGILELKNNSEQTIQEAWVNDSIYGTLKPGKSLQIKLLPAVYTWELKGINGDGCTPTTGTIIAGSTQKIQCSIK